MKLFRIFYLDPDHSERTWLTEASDRDEARKLFKSQYPWFVAFWIEEVPGTLVTMEG